MLAQPTRPVRSTLFWSLQVGGWLLFWAGMVLAGLTHWSAGFTLAHKTSLAVGGFLSSSLLRLAYRRLARSGTGTAIRAAATLPLSWLAAALWMPAHNEIVARLIAGGFGGAGLATRPFPDFTNTIYYSFLLLAWSALYLGVQAYLDLVEERGRLRRAEELAHAARAEALRLQLQPHFLFNALNSISTLIAERRNDDANRMLSRLSDFLRRTLEAPPSATGALAAEIEFARRYLEIEQIRFGDRLGVEIEVDPDLRDAPIPTLLLQPLVENAVRHAIAPREGGGQVAIRATSREGELTIDVEDDGPGTPVDAGSRGGLGLANCRRRLAELYGERASLQIGRGAMGGTRARVRLPLVAAGEART